VVSSNRPENPTFSQITPGTWEIATAASPYSAGLMSRPIVCHGQRAPVKCATAIATDNLPPPIDYRSIAAQWGRVESQVKAKPMWEVRVPSVDIHKA
jgi:hypothetical protein